MKKASERKKPGRKTLDKLDKKQPVLIYATGRQIEANGGIEKCREKALRALA